MQPSKHNEISPSEIKRIRKSLDLSQTEAGERLGGGTSAFAKYENGSVKPSAALVKMLRFLQKRPEELEAISGKEDKRSKSGPMPFDVTSENVTALNPRDFSGLVEKLLSAEALHTNLPLDGIHVAFNLTTADGGEDARIEWHGGPERTGFLPSRFCQFQLKTGNISPKEAGEEVLTQESKLKPMVQDALERGASYIMLCSRPYTQNLIERRLGEIRKNLENHGFKDSPVQFRDSGQIASWVNCHPCVAAWLLRKTDSELINPSLGGWDHWFRRDEHFSSRWVDDRRLPAFRERLRAIVEVPKGVARVVGPAGTGKSRLVLEALGPTETEGVSGVRLSDLVLYAVESEIGSHKIKEYAWSLANSGKRVVLVIDGCSEETRTDLTNIAKHSDSGLSLVTIETGTRSDVPESENTLFVNAAEKELIEEIIKSQAPHISARDRVRIAGFSGGIISCARITAKSWHKGGFIFSDENEVLIRKYIGHERGVLDPVYEAAKLISVFGEIGIEPPYEEQEQVAQFGSHSARQDFQTCINKLRNRGVVVLLSGGFVRLRPEHIAIRLAERQWSEWSQSQREEILVGYGLSDELRIRVADRLALLNTGTVASVLVRHILGKETLWFSPENLRRNIKLLYSFAQIDPQRVADLLEEILKTLPPAELQDETISYDLIEILRKIAFPEETFEVAGTILLKLAYLGNKGAGEVFASLFPVRLAGTEAGWEKRLSLIDQHINADNNTLLSIMVDALAEGTKTAFFSRTIAGEGPETHGSRPVLESWSPKGNEGWDYIKQCTERLVELAKRSGDIGEKARDVLGRNLYGYVVNGFLIEDVERWLAEIKEKHPYWPEALVALGNILKHYADELPSSMEARVEKLMLDLEPCDLEDRVQFFLQDMPYGHFYRKNMDEETHLRVMKEKVEQLGEDLLDCENKFERLIPKLCAGEQSMTVRLLGLSLAKKAQKPSHWKKRIMDALEAVSDPDERNYDLLVGYMEGLGERDRKEFREFKKHAKTSPAFAPVLPSLMFYTGISSGDIEIIIEALEAGLITHEEMSAWHYSSKLSELEPEDVIPLFDLMLKKGEMPFFESGLKLVCAYLRENDQLLGCLHSQLLLASEYPSVIRNERSRELSLSQDSGNPVGNLAGEQSENTSTGIDDWGDIWKNIGGFYKQQPVSPTAGLEYATLMNLILSLGNENPDARAVAVSIAKQIAEKGNMSSYLDQEIIKLVLPDLLSNFGEVVWPLLASAIEKNKAQFLDMMGYHLSSFYGTPPVLNLPENTLFGWCHANPEVGPAFVAEAVPLLASVKNSEEEVPSEEFHPLIKRLIDEFGDRQDVLDALESHMDASKAAVPTVSAHDRFASYRRPLGSIENHAKGAVRRWAGKMLRKISDETD